MSRLDETRAALDAELAKGSSGGYDQFLRLADAARAHEHEMYLAHHCYGGYDKCISCGCSQGTPCVSHQGSPKHLAEMQRRQVELLEEIAAQRRLPE